MQWSAARTLPKVSASMSSFSTIRLSSLWKSAKRGNTQKLTTSKCWNVWECCTGSRSCTWTSPGTTSCSVRTTTKTCSSISGFLRSLLRNVDLRRILPSRGPLISSQRKWWLYFRVAKQEISSIFTLTIYRASKKLFEAMELKKNLLLYHHWTWCKLVWLHLKKIKKLDKMRPYILLVCSNIFHIFLKANFLAPWKLITAFILSFTEEKCFNYSQNYFLLIFMRKLNQ